MEVDHTWQVLSHTLPINRFEEGAFKLHVSIIRDLKVSSLEPSIFNYEMCGSQFAVFIGVSVGPNDGFPEILVSRLEFFKHY
jgi:hypothetical protein